MVYHHGPTHAIPFNLMAGGSGSVHFFGYRYPDSDLDMEDWRSRDHFWDLQRYAHEFFTKYLPFHRMRNANAMTAAPNDFVFAQPGEICAVHLPDGGSTEIDLSAAEGAFEVKWYDPRYGGDLQNGSVRTIHGGGKRLLGNPPKEPAKDWAPGSAHVHGFTGRQRANARWPHAISCEAWRRSWLRHEPRRRYGDGCCYFS